ncbi:MAG: hypothetical protein HKN00_00570 [Flavobacteriaceae bacterium]|nr:hypothetical protein [Bacteroidia bacterium]NNF73649.1 hypothetical protein [Flavobacteriaceae bacterium]NNK73974.1 hypothetical protein [Flavobacteriaceae bacterium]
MKRTITFFSVIGIVIMMMLGLILLGCQKKEPKVNIDQVAIEEEAEGEFETVYWYVKAFNQKGKLLSVMAVDEDGHTYELKAIQDADQTSVMDVKAFVNEKILPVKVLVSLDKYLPVKAIDEDGTILDVKAFTEEGDKLDVKGVRQSGNIIHLSVVDKNGLLYNIEAISPKGWINDVKGIKMMKETVEMTINGVDVYAHIKAIAQQY